MSTRCYRGRTRRPVQTTLGKAPLSNDNDPIDLSHLRKPIDTSVYGLSHVLKLFETATDEVRRYISYECDIIYECRACRTLFRSLGNFILHKRCYCQEVFQPMSTFSNVDFEVSDTEISYDGDRNSKKECSDSDESQKKPKKIETVLQKMAERRENLKISNEVASRELSKENKPDDREPVENKLFLERIESTTNVVYQTVPESSVGTELMKTEAMEIHSILNNNEAILSSDGKLFTFDTDKQTSKVAKKLHCPVCMLKFSTKKTLTFHIKYKHNETRLVYICPECKDTFANAWCVFRHLYKVHRKNTSQIRKLRDYVHSSAVAKKQEGFKKKEIVSGDDICRENQWSSGLEGDQMCSGCGKKFERKAALQAHSLRCTKRMASSHVKRNSEENSPPKQKTIVLPGKGSDKRKSGVVRRMVKKTIEKPIEKLDDKTVLEKTAIEEIIFGTAREEVADLPIVLQCDDEDTLGFSNADDKPKQSDHAASIDSSSQMVTNDTPLVECISIEDDSNDSSKPELPTNNPEEVLVQVISVSPDVNLDAIIEDSHESVELIEIKDEPDTIHSNLANDTQMIPENKLQESVEGSVGQTSISETETRKLKKRKRAEDTPSLRIKSHAYISWENSKCNSCDLKFISHYYLMKHMALHFNWQRFQCSRCMFTCYDKMVCVRHVQSEHRIDQRILDNFVVQLETVASAEMATDFKPIDLDRYCSESNGAKHGLVLNESVEVKNVKESPKDLDKQDPMVRKMIMEVIFGSDVQANFGNCSNSLTSAITRPARNRTSVKELQTDFVYDMNETDTEMDAPTHRIKPIKIVKNNEFDFKVVKEDGLKRKKS